MGFCVSGVVHMVHSPCMIMNVRRLNARRDVQIRADLRAQVTHNHVGQAFLTAELIGCFR